MRNITLEELLEAGCHFGHQVTRQNPRARDFVFEARDNIHIIDLAKTKEGLDEAAAFVKSIASRPDSTFLVVGTKRQAQPIIDEELKRVGGKEKNMFFVTRHWVGGTLTNFSAVQKNFEKLKDLGKKLVDDEVKARYTKKEIGLWEKERQKLEGFYSGIADMKRLPDVIFAVDSHQEDLAVREARRMGVKVVGIVDTNADPDLVDYVIPANDDAVGSLKLLIGHIFDAWNEGKTEGPKETKESKETKEPKATEGKPAKKAEKKTSTKSPKTAKTKEKETKK